MPADLNADLARSTSAGSPPAIKYRTPPMVRNTVAIPARIVITQVRMLVRIVPRSLGAAQRTGPSAASAGTGVVRTTSTATAAVSAKPVMTRVRVARCLVVRCLVVRCLVVRFMVVHLPPPVWGLVVTAGGVTRKRGGGRGSAAPSKAIARRGVNGVGCPDAAANSASLVTPSTTANGYPW